MSGDRVSAKRLLEAQSAYWRDNPGKAFDEGAFLGMRPKSFSLICDGIDVSGLRDVLVSRPELFGNRPERKQYQVHNQMTDIWVRYNDINKYSDKTLDKFNDAHFPVWYPEYKEMPQIKPIIFDLMSLVKGEHLGGVLITKIPAGGKVLPHTDSGWHASFYDKYYIPIQNDIGCVFGFEDGNLIATPGQIWKFDNSINHWVNNDSQRDRIALIVCIRSDRS